MLLSLSVEFIICDQEKFGTHSNYGVVLTKTHHSKDVSVKNPGSLGAVNLLFAHTLVEPLKSVK